MSSDNSYLRIEVPLEDRQAQIQHFRYVVHTEGQQGTTNLSNNHATLYLLVGRNRSVQINMRHDDDDLNGKLEIVKRNYLISRTEIRHFDFESEDVPTVQEVMDIILQNRMNDFCFSGGGMGCTYWQVVMTQLYEGEGWLPPGSAVRLHQTLSQQYSRLPLTRTFPQLIIAGTFDEQESQTIANRAWVALGSAIREQQNRLRGALDDLTWLITHAHLPMHRTEAERRVRALAGRGLRFNGPADFSQGRDRINTKVNMLEQQRRDLAATATRLIALIRQRQEEDE